MLGSISVRNATDKVVTVELRQVGPLFWKILEPNDVFTFDKIGVMWFTVNVYLGPVYFSKSDVALPIITTTLTAVSLGAGLVVLAPAATAALPVLAAATAARVGAGVLTVGNLLQAGTVTGGIASGIIGRIQPTQQHVETHKHGVFAGTNPLFTITADKYGKIILVREEKLAIENNDSSSCSSTSAMIE